MPTTTAIHATETVSAPETTVVPCAARVAQLYGWHGAIHHWTFGH